MQSARRKNKLQLGLTPWTEDYRLDAVGSSEKQIATRSDPLETPWTELNLNSA